MVSWKDEEDLADESVYRAGYMVPNALFFVRNHTRTPRLDAATWRLSVTGAGLERALELTYENILAMPSHSMTRYVECAGNGRSLFETAYGKRAQGTQWKLGAIGVAEWTGVQLSTILDHAGLKRTARDVMAEGAGRPQGAASYFGDQGPGRGHTARLCHEWRPSAARPRFSRPTAHPGVDRRVEYQMARTP